MSKKIISIFIVLLMLFMSACSSGSIESACVKADQEVNSWYIEGCSFLGRYNAEENIYGVAVSTDDEYYLNDSRLRGAMTEILVGEIDNKFYPRLEKIFSKYDIDIVIGIFDNNGDLYCRIINGRVED